MRFSPFACRRAIGVAAALAMVAGGALAAAASASTTTASTCKTRVLVLSAMPSELGPIYDAAKIDETIKVGDRTFYVGRFAGNNVILALTHIGLVNAEETTRLAYKRFTCSDGPMISAVVFSGVSGGDSNIGDVTVVNRWRYKDGTTWVNTDPTMLGVAKQVATKVKLVQRAPAGDPVCACIDPNLIKTVKIKVQPRVLVGGDGVSADPFGDRRFPCFPSGGNIFGCEPCKAGAHKPKDIPQFVNGIRPMIPSFFFEYFQNQTPSDSTYAAEDMETAAAAKVAAEHQTPFIAFRALSDGDGDKLHLPGFPFQFFYYQEIAAQNAGTVTLAFLKAWATH